MPSFAKFTAIVIANLVESRPIAGWEAAAQLLQRFKQLAVTLEKDWARCPLAKLSHDTDFAGAFETFGTYTGTERRSRRRDTRHCFSYLVNLKDNPLHDAHALPVGSFSSGIRPRSPG